MSKYREREHYVGPGDGKALYYPVWSNSFTEPVGWRLVAESIGLTARGTTQEEVRTDFETKLAARHTVKP